MNAVQVWHFWNSLFWLPFMVVVVVFYVAVLVGVPAALVYGALWLYRRFRP
jgi:hypothetical protein